MRPGFSNYPYTKEYLCISLTPSMYLQTPALLLCKAGAARLLKIIKALGPFSLPAQFPRILNQVFAVMKGTLFSSLKTWGFGAGRNTGVWFLLVCLLPKIPSSSKGLAKPSALHDPTASPRHRILLDSLHGLYTNNYFNSRVCGGGNVTFLCPHMSV